MLNGLMCLTCHLYMGVIERDPLTWFCTGCQTTVAAGCGTPDGAPAHTPMTPERFAELRSYDGPAGFDAWYGVEAAKAVTECLNEIERLQLTLGERVR